MNKLLVFLLLLPFSCLAGEKPIFIGPTSLYYFFSYPDTVNERLYIISKDSLLVLGLNPLRTIARLKPDFPEGMEAPRLIPVSMKGNLYAIDHRGGGVYQIIDEEVIRIDNSFEHRMQFNATIFVRNDTIFRFGGYGFWSARNLFTYFDFKSKEWDIISPLHSKTFPPGVLHAEILIDGDDWYLYSGYQLKEQDPRYHEINQDIWVFHRDQLKWEKVGRAGILATPTTAIIQGNPLILLMDHSAYEVDPIINLSIEYKRDQEFQYRVYTDHYNRSFTLRDHIFLFRPSNDGKLFLVKMAKSEFLGQAVAKTRLYKTGSLSLIIKLSLSAILAVTLFLTWKRARQKNRLIIFTGNRLVFKGRSIDLNGTEMALLDLFLPGDEITSEAIMNITGSSQLHLSQNVRNKNSLIEQLNLKFRILLKTNQNLIAMAQSRVDRRMRVYRLKREMFLVNQNGER